MKTIKEQVLSIEQVQELQKLGFDVRKHASLYFVEEKYFVKENFIVLPEQIDITRVPEDVKITPTMSIGDIMECLPEEIEENVLNIFAFGETWSVGWEGIQYYGSNTLIDALFETLVWCIKQKHIAL